MNQATTKIVDDGQQISLNCFALRQALATASRLRRQGERKWGRVSRGGLPLGGGLGVSPSTSSGLRHLLRLMAPRLALFPAKEEHHHKGSDAEGAHHYQKGVPPQ